MKPVTVIEDNISTLPWSREENIDVRNAEVEIAKIMLLLFMLYQNAIVKNNK